MKRSVAALALAALLFDAGASLAVPERLIRERVAQSARRAAARPGTEGVSAPRGLRKVSHAVDQIRARRKFRREIGSLLRQRDPKGVKIYYHIDFDGVTSALGMKHFLSRQGVKNFEFEGIQYGDREYAITRPKDGWMAVLVDFAHGKPMMQIHTDHHDRQAGASGVTAFVHAQSNSGFISSLTPGGGAFSKADVDVVNMVDAADYAGRFSAEDVRQTVYVRNPEDDEAKDHLRFGMTVNNKVLAIKSKRRQKGGEPNGILNELLGRMDGKPSLAAMDRQLDALMRDYQLDDAKAIQQRRNEFVDKARELAIPAERATLDKIPELEMGASMLLGNLAVQYGANSVMYKGGAYSRYVPFEVHPDAHYLTIAWPMGLLQVSKNPFRKGENPIDLGEFLLGEGGILSRHKQLLENTWISLDDIKWRAERSVTKHAIEGAVGYSWADFTAIYEPAQIRGLDVKGGGPDVATAKRIADKLYRDLSAEEKELLKGIEVNAWDLIQANSGGHHDISQISGLSFLPKHLGGRGASFDGDREQFERQLQVDLARELRHASLQQAE